MADRAPAGARLAPLPPRWRKVARDAVALRSRIALVLAALVLALVAAGTVLDTTALLRRATHDGYRASLPAAATLGFDAVRQPGTALLQRLLAAQPQVAAWRLRRVVNGTLLGGAGVRNAVLISVDGSETGAPIGRLERLDAGSDARWPPRDGEVWIERSSLDVAAVRPGETLHWQGRDGTQPLRVGGVLRDVAQAPGWMEHLVYLYATAATFERIRAGGGFNQLQLRLHDATATREQVQRVAGALQRELEAAGHALHSADVRAAGEHIHAAQMDSLLLTQAAFGALALLVCALLVANLFAALLAAQRREIGVMKAIGAVPSSLTGMYAALALSIGAPATLLAVPLAALAGRRYAMFKAELLNFSLDGITLPAWAWLPQVAVGIVLPLLAAIVPVLRAGGEPAAVLLRDAGIAGGGRLAPRSRLGAALASRLPRGLLLAASNAARRRRRTALTLLALALGGAVQLGAENLRGAVRASVDLLFAAQRHQITLRLAAPQPAARLEALAAAEPGVARAEAWRGQRAALLDADGSPGPRLVLVGLPPSSAQFKPALRQGRWLSEADRDALVISQRLQREQPQLVPGAEVGLELAGQRRRFTVVGVIDGPPQLLAWLPRATLDRIAGDALATTLTIAAADAAAPAAQRELVRRLRETLGSAGMPVAASQLLAENRRISEDHMLMVVDFLGAMGWVMLAVGGIALASTMGIAVLERRRELAVLRALGATPRTLLRLVQGEGLVIALLAWLAALPLSVPLALVLAAAFGRIMFTVPLPWWPDPAAALRWLAALLAVALFAGALPAWRASRLPVARWLGHG